MKCPKNYQYNQKKETEQNLVKIVIVLTKKSAVSKGRSSNLLEEIRKWMVGLIMDEFILTSKETSPKRRIFVKCKSL